MDTIVVETGGWLHTIPEGTAFLVPYDTGITCYDINGEVLEAEHLVDPKTEKKILTVGDLHVDWKEALKAKDLVS